LAAVDYYVSNVTARSPDSLAIKLTRHYQTEHEKVRAIFKWITNNITYNTSNYRNRRASAESFLEDTDDAGDLKPLSERVAMLVLHRKTAVCDGYARLFKTLCDYAGVESEIIRGYARPTWGRSPQFTSNHIWNSVRIDGTWYLLDATWATGYTTYFSNQFVHAFDESYFLTPPEVFIRDHFPEDNKWTLLPKTPAVSEFNTSPFRYAAIHQFRISSYLPSKGIIEASVGDTIIFSLQANDGGKYLRISNSPYVDSTLFDQYESGNYPRPFGLVYSKQVSGAYVVENNYDEWVYVILNEEVIMRYRLLISDRKAALAGNLIQIF
jgi:hypothetical protein